MVEHISTRTCVRNKLLSELTGSHHKVETGFLYMRSAREQMKRETAGNLIESHTPLGLKLSEIKAK